MDVDTTPEPLGDVLPISPAPANEKNPSGSTDEDESETEEEGVRSRGENRPRQEVHELATLDIGDDVADDEAFLPLEVPAGHSLVSSALAALTQVLVNQEVLLRLGSGGSSHESLKHARATATTLECFLRPTAARTV